ncbi:MAG: hypothetical protein GY793_05975 [Proteobacteria bacterium]|nr:hypothetical protein [Pseudomonadota bacterium]
MKDKLNECIEILKSAKDAICLDEPNIQTALIFLEQAQGFIAEFDKLEIEQKKEYKEELLEIQSIAQIINFKLTQEKARLKTESLKGHKMVNAIKGYGRS